MIATLDAIAAGTLRTEELITHALPSTRPKRRTHWCWSGGRMPSEGFDW